MGGAKKRLPAIEGWFRMDGEAPSLLGVRCRTCRTVYFPKEAFCRNPGCGTSELEETPLSRRGRLWSWTDNRYAPPPPYPAGDPFVPYGVAAVELGVEQMIVLGQVAQGVDMSTLAAGQEMELVVEPLYESEDAVHTVWKWRPAE